MYNSILTVVDKGNAELVIDALIRLEQGRYYHQCKGAEPMKLLGYFLWI